MGMMKANWTTDLPRPGVVNYAGPQMELSRGN